MRYIFFFSLLLLGFFGFALFVGKEKLTKAALKNGDMLFIVNSSGQGKAIQLATHSKYTHIGIVFIENGKTMVYHAVEPVKKSTLNEFISMSADGTYEVKRLKDQSLLTDAAVASMLKAAQG